MSKVSNALLMLQYLENGRKYSIKELAQELEVSERMIRSYKDDLEKAGIYIDTIMGPYGGYVLNQSIRIPSRKFSIDDYKFLSNLKVNKENQEKLDIIADKVHGVYFDSKNENIELGEDTKKYYNLLNRAIKEHRKVKINYYSYTNGNQNRIIRPYDMFLYNSGWGCAAYCELRKDLRHFELKRINNIELLEEKF
ncbi:MAG: WYL domain-containing protein [Bacilli bacterium]|nr:WYL domain-containing protein [Bacilli bacterium]